VFAEVVGQEHVVQALSNALDQNRVHHAFLFSGTRGVGKTTIARIFAKCLNCERGISSQPCNECDACVSIDEGRFIDLIEVDAASRTKVEDTRELLDNVQYVPTRGRYKVYLIDEVHMLSGHSFNALLKTLEEPPPHIKFLLATTDPQKLPVTVLSRCLQFNLKALTIDTISLQLERIVEAESVPAEPGALALLARAAYGSMRDALSLIDQAIAHGAGDLKESDVRDMLGIIDARHVHDILQALAERDGENLFAVVESISEQASDFVSVLDELLVQVYNLAVLQQVPEALDARQAREPWHAEMAGKLDAEALQLLYQIALIGKRDMELAPDPRTGFEMVLLRMLAFQPASGSAEVKKAAGVKKTEGKTAPRPPEPVRKPVQAAPVTSVKKDMAQEAAPDWLSLIADLDVNGWVRELAANAVHEKTEGNKIELTIDPKLAHLCSRERVTALADAILARTGTEYILNVKTGAANGESLAQKKQRELEQRQQTAREAINSDPNVQQIIEQFGATLVETKNRDVQ